ncbi:MAG: hypothetical protein ICV77_09705 [Cyanobacteria bacterium Co-bin8]|nr:hypothetical protein [Cyanobacteria bacterium Co-bin8]
MTALVRSEIPAGITTIAQLHTWSGLALEELNRGVNYKEAQGSAIDSGLAPLVDTSIISAADGTKRLILRTSMELAPTYTSDRSKKMWMFTQNMSNALLPANFKVD